MALAGCGGGGGGGHGPTAYSGTVSTPTGPAAGVEVQLYKLGGSGSTLLASTVTDADGHYAFTAATAPTALAIVHAATTPWMESLLLGTTVDINPRTQVVTQACIGSPLANYSTREVGLLTRFLDDVAIDMSGVTGISDAILRIRAAVPQMDAYAAAFGTPGEQVAASGAYHVVSLDLAAAATADTSTTVGPESNLVAWLATSRAGEFVIGSSGTATESVAGNQRRLGITATLLDDTPTAYAAAASTASLPGSALYRLFVGSDGLLAVDDGNRVALGQRHASGAVLLAGGDSADATQAGMADGGQHFFVALRKPASTPASAGQWRFGILVAGLSENGGTGELSAANGLMTATVAGGYLSGSGTLTRVTLGIDGATTTDTPGIAPVLSFEATADGTLNIEGTAAGAMADGGALLAFRQDDATSRALWIGTRAGTNVLPAALASARFRASGIGMTLADATPAGAPGAPLLDGSAAVDGTSLDISFDGYGASATIKGTRFLHSATEGLGNPAQTDNATGLDETVSVAWDGANDGHFTLTLASGEVVDGLLDASGDYLILAGRSAAKRELLLGVRTE